MQTVRPQDARRKKWEARARQLIKDIVFLLEKLEKMDKFPQRHKDEMPEQREFVNRIGSLVRNGTINEAAINAVETLHKQIIRHLFEMSDDDGGGVLDQSEIKGLAKAMGAKLTEDELKLAMQEMDEDGSGEVDFAEFYDWWSKDKDSGVLTSDAEKNALFTMEIIPLEYT